MIVKNPLCGWSNDSEKSHCRFRRQHVVGRHIVDFCCVEQKLIIELDGGQHATSRERDEARTTELTRSGYLVLRFWNHELLMDLEAVMEAIARALREHPALDGA